MANMNHPGLYNRIIDQEIPAGLKLGSELNHTGSAWKTGFEILGFYIPHWLLTIVALLLFACSVGNSFGYLSINPTIPWMISFFGLIHVAESALGFFSQGNVGWGLILTGAGYLIFLISFLRWK